MRGLEWNKSKLAVEGVILSVVIIFNQVFFEDFSNLNVWVSFYFLTICCSNDRD